jgi:hypothetical protein
MWQKHEIKSLCSRHPHHSPIHTFYFHAAIDAPFPFMVWSACEHQRVYHTKGHVFAPLMYH